MAALEELGVPYCESEWEHGLMCASVRTFSEKARVLQRCCMPSRTTCLWPYGLRPLCYRRADSCQRIGAVGATRVTSAMLSSQALRVVKPSPKTAIFFLVRRDRPPVPLCGCVLLSRWRCGCLRLGGAFPRCA